MARKRLFQATLRLDNPITVSLHFQSLLVQEAGCPKMSFQIIFGSGDLMRTPQWIQSCWGWHREEGPTVQTTLKNQVSPEPLLGYRMMPWKLKRNIEPQAPPQTCYVRSCLLTRSLGFLCTDLKPPLEPSYLVSVLDSLPMSFTTTGVKNI